MIENMTPEEEFSEYLFYSLTLSHSSVLKSLIESIKEIAHFRLIERLGNPNLHRIESGSWVAASK